MKVLILLLLCCCVSFSGTEKKEKEALRTERNMPSVFPGSFPLTPFLLAY